MKVSPMKNQAQRHHTDSDQLGINRAKGQKGWKMERKQDRANKALTQNIEY